VERAPSSRAPPAGNAKSHKAQIRRPNVYSRLGSCSLRFVTVIVHYVRRTTLFVRKSTLIVRKCLELRRTLRIRVFSCRRTFNVSFCVSCSEANLWRGIVFHAERNKKKTRSCPSIDCLLLLVESCQQSSKRRRRLLSFFPLLGKSFVAIKLLPFEFVVWYMYVNEI